ncbi:MAG: hypothetical protein SF162_01395 [bacterium]|nr:hypothetical protein [bacterium]
MDRQTTLLKRARPRLFFYNLWLWVVTACAAAFTLLTGFVTAAPQFSTPIDRTLAPPGCAAPCLFGVRPGAMSGEEAVRALEQHPWVRADSIAISPSYLSWIWNGDQPEGLRRISGSANFIDLSAGAVRRVSIPSRYRLGDIYAALGVPDHAAFVLRGFSGPRWNREVSATVSTLWTYEALGLQIWATGACPLTAPALWNLPVVFYAPPLPTADTAPLPPPNYAVWMC